MYEKELLSISNQIKEAAAIKDELVKKAESTKLDTTHVLNFIKFFAK